MQPEERAQSPSPPSDSVQELLERMRPRIRRVLSSYRIPAQDAEDLLQEALLVTVKSWDCITNKEGWLLVTLRHKCSIYWRGHRARKVQAVDPEFLEDLAGAEAPPQEREELLRDLERLLASLGSRHRALIHLRFGLGLTPEEVAEILGYEVSSVRKLTCRSVARLQKTAERIATYTRP